MADKVNVAALRRWLPTPPHYVDLDIDSDVLRALLAVAEAAVALDAADDPDKWVECRAALDAALAKLQWEEP